MYWSDAGVKFLLGFFQPMRASRLLFFCVFYAILPAYSQSALPVLPEPDVAGIIYATEDDLDLKLDIYYPSQKARPYPVILWIHGGGWQGDSRADARPALMLRDSGYAIVSIDYRLSQTAKWPAQIHDCKAAVRWLRARGTFFGLDTARIAAWGSSAGGHLAALLGTTADKDSLEGGVGGYPGQSTRVQGVVNFYGPVDLLSLDDTHMTPDGNEGRLLGCAIPDCLDKARSASPVTYIDSGDAPFLTFHGTRDVIVPFVQSQRLDSLLGSAGVFSILRSVKDAEHGGSRFLTDSIMTDVSAFLKKVFQGAAEPGVVFHAEGNPEDTSAGMVWRYVDSASPIPYEVNGLILKPHGVGPFPAIVLSHGVENSLQYGLKVGPKLVSWGYAVIVPRLTHAEDSECGEKQECTREEWGASDENVRRGLKSAEILAGLGYADTTRLIAFGSGLGAWSTMAMVTRYPDRFWAAAHVVSHLEELDSMNAEKFQNVEVHTPYLMHHGDSGKLSSVALAQRLDSLLIRSGVNHRVEVYSEHNPDEMLCDSTILERTRHWFAERNLPPIAVAVSPFVKARGDGEIQVRINDFRNGILRLEYSLPEGASGTIALFDLHGRRFGGRLIQGAGVLSWNALTNAAGRPAAGIYMVQVRVLGHAPVTLLTSVSVP